MRPSGWPNTRDYTKWFFNFSVSTRVRIHGVAIFGRKSVSSDYEVPMCHICTVTRHLFEVNVSLLNASSGESLAITQRTTTTDASEDTYKVLFECPVLVRSSGLTLLSNYYGLDCAVHPVQDHRRQHWSAFDVRRERTARGQMRSCRQLGYLLVYGYTTSRQRPIRRLSQRSHSCDLLFFRIDFLRGVFVVWCCQTLKVHSALVGW